MPADQLAPIKSIAKAAPHLEIGRQVAEHAGARLFDARQIDVNRRILLRVVPIGQCSAGSSRPNIESAVARLKTLKHAGIASVCGGSAADGFAFFEIEHSRGTPLQRFLAGRVLSDSQCLEIALQIAEALEYLMSQELSYEAALPQGVQVSRQVGSLRLVAKLCQVEAIRARRGRSADLQSFADTLKLLTSRHPTSNESTIQSALRAMATRIGSNSSSTRLNDLVAELRTLKRKREIEQANFALHAAEPLPYLAEPQLPSPTSTMSVGKAAAIVIGATAAIITAFIMIDPDLSSRDAHGRKTYSIPQPPTYQPVRPQSSVRRPIDAGQAFDRERIHSERTFHFFTKRSPPGFGTLSKNNFSRPRARESELREDATALSTPSWGTSAFGHSVLEVDLSCSEEIPRAHRLVWVLETGEGEDFEAHLHGDLNSLDKLRGQLSPALDQQLQGPFKTYLAVDEPFADEPQRISNVLEFEEAPSE